MVDKFQTIIIYIYIWIFMHLKIKILDRRKAKCDIDACVLQIIKSVWGVQRSEEFIFFFDEALSYPISQSTFPKKYFSFNSKTYPLQQFCYHVKWNSHNHIMQFFQQKLGIFSEITFQLPSSINIICCLSIIWNNLIQNI